MTGKPRTRRWLVPVICLALVLSLTWLVKAFVVQVFVIPSSSMEPILEPGDRILVDRNSGEPQRGDVVVFADPGGWIPGKKEPNLVAKALGAVGLLPTSDHLVKRVIGVAGDTIECCDDQGRLLLNGVPLDESGFLSRDPQRACDGVMRGCDWKAGPVPAGTLFVMGDNRSNTGDSTQFLCVGATDCTDSAAYVDTDLVVGQVWLRVWPPDRWGGLERPAAFDNP